MSAMSLRRIAASLVFAKVDEIDKVPLSASQRENFYRKFFDSKVPRAFALGNCQRRRGEPCRLYAVDDDVVWAP